ncbi:DinB family protein [Lysinibacillus irui]|uniref:DinB family protein n=1 Tax=Lysinibacillus irui TaxID=2998077 RepID=A0AAJ5RU96_9BACI|nr:MULTISPECIES: DinB family protein [Lysinibacillus]MEA0553437.1 DinB family protein [Lysinibacillus irui]MEA0562283.1 DinB family protein [Lysinibacillus irui]MEA0978803.1 DinB family protein [Lysinibacillus irui]MEA1044957.1 DinB family protein [Lysinibacillus irui]WDV08688.1 DinB family protein [Lysinibacillus irui]
MFQTVEDFLQSWSFEAAATHKLLNQLTDESLNQVITADNWTLGRIAWHTVAAIRIITSNTNLSFEAPAQDFPVPTSAQLIADRYLQASQAFVDAIQTQWTDETMKEKIEFIGQQMPNGSLLLFLLQHQSHHRGQMTVLMRQAGLTVPGIYGPAKEEWAQYGLEAPQM